MLVWARGCELDVAALGKEICGGQETGAEDCDVLEEFLGDDFFGLSVRAFRAEGVVPSNLDAGVLGCYSGLVVLRNICWEKEEDDFFAEVDGVLC